MSKQAALDLYKSGSKRYREIYKLWNSATTADMKGLHVHHKDHDHKNNHPENLELLTPDEHAKKHGFISNFIMAQSTAVERAAHPEVRKRAASHGKDNGMFGKSQKDFMTDPAYQLMCDNKKGSKNPQYGNVGRITGDKNPMKNLSKEEKALFILIRNSSSSPEIKCRIGDPI